MIYDITFFDTPKDIEKLTGLTIDELWKHGFNLDDMDCGFCTPSIGWAEVIQGEDEYGYKHTVFAKNEWEMYLNGEMPTAIYRLLDNWSNYCVGYYIACYDDKTYVTLHHA